MKTYDKKDIKRILRNNGYTLHHQKGSHEIYKNENGQHLTIRFRDCNKMVFQRLIKEYGLEVK
jgi:predicted RNA binding protein YcfA (HicA-like mRNA interferase family)